MVREPTPSTSPRGLRPLLQKTKKARQTLRRVIEELEAAVEEAEAAVEWEMDEGVLDQLLWVRERAVASLEALARVEETVEGTLSEAPTARRLLRFLSRQPRQEAELSYAELAERISAGERATIQRAQDLERRGKIEILRGGPGRGRNNLYRLVQKEREPGDGESRNPEEDKEGNEKGQGRGGKRPG